MAGVVDIVSVSMSPQLFKGFLRAAGETLKAYENTFGALSIPDQDITPTRNADQLQALIALTRAAAAAQQATSSTSPAQPSEQSSSVPQEKEKRP